MLYAFGATSTDTSQRIVRLYNHYRTPEETTRGEIVEIVEIGEIHVEIGEEEAAAEVADREEEDINPQGPLIWSKSMKQQQ